MKWILILLFMFFITQDTESIKNHETAIDEIEEDLDENVLLSIPDSPSSSSRARSRTRRKSILRYLWPREEGIPTVAYDDTQLIEDQHLDYVYKAMEYWTNHTCVRFRKRIDSEEDMDVALFVNGSFLGRTIGHPPGLQSSIDFHSWTKSHHLLRDVGRVLGLMPEILRIDRNDHIHVITENLKPKVWYPILANPKYFSTYGAPFDFLSIMQYEATMDTNSGGITRLSKIPKYQSLICQSKEPSFWDIKVISMAYKCLDEWLSLCNLESNICENDGYIGKNCSCICRRGTEGDRCQHVVSDYYSDVFPKCNKEVIENGTTIQSPNFPGVAPPGTTCVYQAKAPDGFVVLINLDSYIMQEGTCGLSVLHIIEFINGNISQTVCCELKCAPGDIIVSKTTEVNIYFMKTDYSDSSVVGFSATISYMKPEDIKLNPTVSPNTKVTTVQATTPRWVTTTNWRTTTAITSETLSTTMGLTPSITTREPSTANYIIQDKNITRSMMLTSTTEASEIKATADGTSSETITELPEGIVTAVTSHKTDTTMAVTTERELTEGGTTAATSDILTSTTEMPEIKTTITELPEGKTTKAMCKILATTKEWPVFETSRESSVTAVIRQEANATTEMPEFKTTIGMHKLVTTKTPLRVQKINLLEFTSCAMETTTTEGDLKTKLNSSAVSFTGRSSIILLDTRLFFIIIIILVPLYP